MHYSFNVNIDLQYTRISYWHTYAKKYL